MKKLIVCLLTLAMILCLASCGGDKDVDLEKLAKELLDSGAFTDQMSAPAEGVPQQIYGYDGADVEKCVMYYGTGATAEEIFLVKCVDSAAAGRLQSLCQTRAQNQIAAFESYVPAEVPKLQSAVIGTAGQYAVMVVSNDSSTCQGIVEKYLNG